MRASAILAFAWMFAAGPAALGQQDASKRQRPVAAPVPNLNVTAALVDRDMQVRPVPLHALQLSGPTDTVLIRTGLDGKVAAAVAPGVYTITSISPIQFQDKHYRWQVTVTVQPGTPTDVSLTNDNALNVAAEQPSAASRVDPAAALFTRFHRSVFRIQAGLAHGSGFLADTLGGVIITNSHVVEAADTASLSVVLDSITRVRAQLLARDGESDIAVLRLAPEHLAGRPRLPLQNPIGKAPVVAGERLTAMGYPLNQELTVTSGIASSIRAGAIISDVNINHGNSGGPLFNIDGEVVAVNTFGDFTSQGGPGVSGSILVSRAGAALSRAASDLARPGPSPDPLPVMPIDQLDVATLKAYADTANPSPYKAFSGIDVGGFDVTLLTPAQTFIAAKVFERDIAKDRKKRERLAGLPESERYSEVRDVRDWGEYVGIPTAPVLSVAVVPKVGETGGSLFTRIMLGPGLKATYKFKGDVRGVWLFRNGELVEPIKGGHAPVKMYVDNQWVSLKDVADQGFYVYDIETLRPDSTGSPPQLVIAVRDLKSPNRLKCRELRREVLAQAWNDFEAFFQIKRPASGFLRADPKAAADRKSAYSSGFMKQECEWNYY